MGAGAGTGALWRQRLGLLVSFVPFVVAGLGLLLIGRDGVRYSADHDGTRPLWMIWLPALLGIILVRYIPPALPRYNPLAADRGRRLLIGAAVCTLMATLFAVALPLVRGDLAGQLWFIGLKLVLLVAVPLLTFRFLRRGQPTPPLANPFGRWYWLGPIVPTLAWFGLVYFGPLAPPSGSGVSIDLATVIAVFLINAVLEEAFYRFWLQTRLEALLGRWIGIALASQLWAVWHVGIQGMGQFGIDLASAIANQGVQGLFLGYLWSRYRSPWAPILIHGAINAPLSFLMNLSL